MFCNFDIQGDRPGAIGFFPWVILEFCPKTRSKVDQSLKTIALKCSGKEFQDQDVMPYKQDVTGSSPVQPIFNAKKQGCKWLPERNLAYSL